MRHVFRARVGGDQILFHSMDRCFNRHVLFHSPDRRFERELWASDISSVRELSWSAVRARS